MSAHPTSVHHHGLQWFCRWLVGRGSNDELAARSVAATANVKNEADKLTRALDRGDPFERLLGDIRKQK